MDWVMDTLPLPVPGARLTVMDQTINLDTERDLHFHAIATALDRAGKLRIPGRDPLVLDRLLAEQETTAMSVPKAEGGRGIDPSAGDGSAATSNSRTPICHGPLVKVCPASSKPVTLHQYVRP